MNEALWFKLNLRSTLKSHNLKTAKEPSLIVNVLKMEGPFTKELRDQGANYPYKKEEMLLFSFPFPGKQKESLVEEGSAWDWKSNSVR